MGESGIEELGTPHCPRCEAVIAAENISMKEGMALCSKCGVLRQVPAGCAVVREGRSVVATASFEAEDVTSVHVGETSWRNKGASSGQPLVEISAGRDIRIGSQLTHDRMTWMIAVLWACWSSATAWAIAPSFRSCHG